MKGKIYLLLLFIETGGDEHPDLVEDDRSRKKEGRHEGYLEIGDECLGEAREDERAMRAASPSMKGRMRKANIRSLKI